MRRKLTSAGRAAGRSALEDSIPESPPASVQRPYLRLSTTYVRWCAGMLAWSIGCVGYFIFTSQWAEMLIGLCVGALMVVMLFMPAALFGGPTWYKRLGWITLLLGLFTAMFFYPIGVAAVGVVRRAAQGRYTPYPSLMDIWHLLLSLLTLGLFAWTVLLTVRAGRLVNRLAKGRY